MWWLLLSRIFDSTGNSCSHFNHYDLLLILQATQLDLHRHFYTLGAGVIEEVRVQRDKGFGFVRFSTHAEAALAIQMGNTQSYLCGKLIKVHFPHRQLTCFHNLCSVKHTGIAISLYLYLSLLPLIIIFVLKYSAPGGASPLHPELLQILFLHPLLRLCQVCPQLIFWATRGR